MKNAFITGVTGQDGAYLAKLLLEKGYKVYGGMRRNSLNETYRLDTLGITQDVHILNFDLTDKFSVLDLIQKNQFDEVYNLAAQSFVGSSWDIPTQTTEVNASGALNLLEAIRRFSPHTRFYQASTSEMFGKIQENIQNEDTPFYPRSPYGVAKLYAHWMTKNYRESFGLFTSCGILFNHESPLRGSEFVTKKITSQLSEIKVGKREKLFLGNLDAKRDWGYAADYVDGMWRMLQASKADDFVLATSQTHTVRDFVNWTAEALSLQIEWIGSGKEEVGVCKKTGKKIVQIDPRFYRPAEVDVLIGDYSKAESILGWKPETTIKQLVSMMVEFDMKNLNNG